ncbi:MAG: hypothetical protein H0U27_04980 [Nitrosopumilus sp.]|nr:hypothetical protein [Nitrosopumilus sp.]
MKKIILYSSILLFYGVSITGCSKYTVTTDSRNPADVIYKKTVAKSYLWGIINKPHTVVDTTCGMGGLSEVKITSNFGHSVIHVVTLGIVHLVKVETKCQKEPPVIGQ